MTDNDKTIASAKKAARRMARATDASYQNCLDTIARKAGRAHWGAFLKDPVEIDESATERSDPRPAVMPGEPGVSDVAAKADQLTRIILLKAILNDMDAIGLRSGSIQTWRIGESSQEEHVPEAVRSHMQGAFSRLVGHDAGQAGSYGFVFEGKACVLVVGEDDSLRISLRGADLASWFGSLSPSDRVAPDGTMAIAPWSSDDRGPSHDRPGRSGRAPGILASILTKMDRVRADDPVRRACARRLVGVGGWRGNGPLLGTTVDGRTLHMPESLPVLVAAPPGVGKTAGTVIPTILTAERTCLVVHDETDLWETTSGTRAALGDVHVLRLDGRPSKGSLNPLHPLWVPSDPTTRSTYLRCLASAASPEDVGAAARIHDAMVAEIATSSNPTLAGAAMRLRRDDPADAWRDPACARAFAAMEPLLDAGVVSCTSDASIAPADLRGTAGRRTAEGWTTWRPSTLYVVRGRTSGERHGRVAAILQAAIWSHVLAHGPSGSTPGGAVSGTLPLMTIIEGCGRLPTMPMLATALEMGRSARVGHMIVGHTSRDVTRLLDERHRHAHESLFAMRIVHRQNDVVEAATVATRFQDLDTTDVLTMGNDRHLLSVQNAGKPLWMRTRFFFQDPELLTMTYNHRTGKGPRPVVPR